MAEMTSYVGIVPRTVIPSAVALVRGVRVARASTGLVAVSDATVRGDYVTITSCAASEPVQVCSMQDGSKVPALASEAAAIGDPAYSAASGKFSKTSTNAVLCGKWTLAASGDGVLGEVELLNPL